MSFDEKDYWRGRHRTHAGNVRAVGIDGLSERANAYSYRSVQEQYAALLDKLALPASTRVVDAGAGIGFYTRMLHARGFDVTAVDISREALDGIDLPIEKKCSSLRDAGFAPASFDLVHSFDVVYHIMSDREWRETLEAFCDWSRRYIILHERFFRTPQLLPSRIIKTRTVGQTSRLLRARGFVEVESVPTHVVSHLQTTYMLTARAPEPFYKVDRWLLDRITGTRLRALGSHHIKVFERR